MFQERARTLQGISLFLDVLCICVAFIAAFVLRAVHGNIPMLNRIPSVSWTAETYVPSDYAVLLGLSVVGWVLSLRTSGVYLSHRSERYPSVLAAYVRALALAVLATGAATFVLKIGISRIFFVYYFVVAFTLLLAKQAVVVACLREMRRHGLNLRNALVIGSGKPASWFCKVLIDAKQTGYNLVGLLLTRKIVSAETADVPVIGTLDDLDAALTNHPVDEVFVVGGASEIAELAPVAQRLLEKGRVVSLITPLYSGHHGTRGRVTEFSGVPMISFGPMPQDEVVRAMKRTQDVVLSLAALLLSAPLILAAALMIKFADGGPVFFRQKRIGFSGRNFDMIKLRTMRADAEEVLRDDARLYAEYLANDCKLPESRDPRFIVGGRTLRKFSIDELPQFFNVLRGDMSIVGPRPILPEQIGEYGDYAPIFLSTKPGITGLWQTEGRSDISYPQRAHMDLDYASGYSLASDFRIMARTLPAVVRGRGAF